LLFYNITQYDLSTLGEVVLKICLFYSTCVNNFTKLSQFHLHMKLLIYEYLKYDLFHSVVNFFG